MNVYTVTFQAERAQLMDDLLLMILWPFGDFFSEIMTRMIMSPYCLFRYLVMGKAKRESEKSMLQEMKQIYSALVLIGYEKNIDSLIIEKLKNRSVDSNSFSPYFMRRLIERYNATRSSFDLFLHKHYIDESGSLKNSFTTDEEATIISDAITLAEFISNDVW